MIFFMIRLIDWELMNYWEESQKEYMPLKAFHQSIHGKTKQKICLGGKATLESRKCCSETLNP